jgi:hypothetical protein
MELDEGRGLVLGGSVDDVQPETMMVSYTVVVPGGLLSMVANVTCNRWDILVARIEAKVHDIRYFT